MNKGAYMWNLWWQYQISDAFSLDRSEDLRPPLHPILPLQSFICHVVSTACYYFHFFSCQGFSPPLFHSPPQAHVSLPRGACIHSLQKAAKSETLLQLQMLKCRSHPWYVQISTLALQHRAAVAPSILRCSNLLPFTWTCTVHFVSESVGACWLQS